ncbi:unnamed protein product [Peronospora belbahrii]|uniref:PHD-type domain-containing protein n=1 Tax=Peronospora belbahrii TaxID=622444 RepID=A0AAU9KMH4_9STRA|nr:unnamed protein product [Peronospora belbahrii]
MSRRSGVSDDTTTGEHDLRERSDSVSSGSGSYDTATAPQFVPLHSRVGKKYQATIPELLASPRNGRELLYTKQALEQPRSRFCADRAHGLGTELDKYLKLAWSLRDGATFDTQEQVTMLALQLLHRFDYNTKDAACSLYARHSIELPISTLGGSQTKLTTAEEAKMWLLAFYRCMRQPKIDTKVLEYMCELHEKAKSNADVVPATEAGLLHEAEDMQIVLPEKEAVVSRLQAFDTALTQLKEALQHTSSSKRHQSKKVELKELDELFKAVMAPQLFYPEEDSFRETVDEAKELKAMIDNMLEEGKVSLPVVRDVLAKIELIPVNFEQEVEQFQTKMLSAQTWLARARKCMPNRRATRRAGGADTKKMDLEAIRALVDDAPCEHSTEMFEIQDLLVCADEWAAKVQEALNGGADVTLSRLKEILDEAKDIPVVMDEQKYLEAEIAAREWCTTAALKLASRKSIEEIEDLIVQANTIRERIYPKKQLRWKPQIERDIHATMNQARKWINELRDNLGITAFDKLYASLSSYVPSPHSSRSSVHSSVSYTDRAKKKSMDAISKLIEKSQSLAVDVSSYTTPLNDLLLKGVEAQAEASAILMSIGCLSGTNGSDTLDGTTKMEMNSMPRELGDLAQASSLLERVDAFPFTFEEGLSLASIVEGEKSWAARVRDCIPPRQSRKKRLSKNAFSTEQLHELLNESKKLRFLFRDELRILSKELSELTMWRAKAHEVINGAVSASIGKVVDRLRTFDLLVYGKLQKAKKKLRIGDTAATDADQDTNASVDMVVPSAQPHDSPQAITEEAKTNECAMQIDAEGLSDSQPPAEDIKQENVKPEVANGEKRSVVKQDAKTATVSGTKSISATGIADINTQVLEIHADSIMTQVRIESGCMQKSVTTDEKDDTSASDLNTVWMSKSGCDLLELVLKMAEESFEAVNSLELKEAEARQTVEELVLAGEKGDIAENITDQSVRALDKWKQHLLHAQIESDLLSVEASEQQALSLIISLLEWLQGSRSLFYDETLPLQDLVATGHKIAEKLEEFKAIGVITPKTLETLEQMLWPLPYLKAHEKVVLEWTERVQRCVANKHAHVRELQALLDSGSGLLLEQGTFKVVMDEVKKARIWLSKLKKRVRALITKGVGRMSMAAARSLVEEGEDIAIDIPVFDFLKEHLEIASDWENRVLGSGIETGQARVGNLLALLNEYECARLVIDLDMHRNVLQTATERYCICRQPFDGLMIGCDYCDDWFHDNCIGMSKEKAEKVEHYTCPSCMILEELAAMLQQAKVVGQRSNLWDMHEYAKAFEKDHASALRKVKREEKTVERTEMLLFSCNNQINQLRARFDDIERAKACLAINPVTNNAVEAPNSSHQPSQLKLSSAAPSLAAAVPSASCAVASVTAAKTATSVLAPPVVVDANALLLATAASSAPTTSASCNRTATSSTAVAPTLAPVLNRQHYPSILIPTMRAVNNALKSAPKLSAVAKSAATMDADASTSASSVNGKKDLKELPNGSMKSATSIASAVTMAASVAVSSHQLATVTVTTATAAPTSTLSIQQTSTPALLNPITATLVGNTERLAALVVAGGVEHQLAKIKCEHVEASKQALELQSSLHLSRERLLNAQKALRELSDVFHARHRMLPYAQTWIQQAVSLLNTTSLLSRTNIDCKEFLPQEFATALDAMMSSPPDTDTSFGLERVSISIDKLFPAVDIFAKLLRTVSWSQVVVSLLQERPSRSEISNAISYATEFRIWEDKKVLTPLRSLIGRVDAWVSRVHKCMTRSGTKTQQLSRLKVLMNEYSKLPLTYAKTAEPLDVYIKVLTGVGINSMVKSEDEPFTLEAAETAAAKALDKAMLGLSSSVAVSGAGAMGTTKKQEPRKRKAYTKKEKAPPRSLKKMKRPQDGLNMVPSATNSVALVTTSNAELTAPTGVGTSQNAST